MELERAYPGFQEQGLGVAAISYDSPAILEHFAERMGGFNYALLSDPESAVIQAFGLLNRNIAEDHAFYGMARPGTFVVDTDGVVVSKHFEPGHRQRFTAESLLVREFGVGGGTRTEVDTDHLKVVAYPAQNVASRGNRITLVFELELPAGMHVYAPGVQGYRPVVVSIPDEAYLKVHDTAFPDSTVMRLPAIDESVPVYHGSARILQDVTLSPRLPGYDQPEATELLIPAKLSYQACDDKVCYVPTDVPVTFKLKLVPHDGQRVPDPLRKKAGGS